MVRRLGLWGSGLTVALIVALLMLPSAGAADPRPGASGMAGMAMPGNTGVLAVRVSRCSPEGCVDLRLVRTADGVTAVDNPEAGISHTVGIVSYAFQPMTLTVPLSTTVIWTNRATIDHTTTSNTGLWDSGPLAPGHSFAHRFTRAGIFRYHCSIHPFMTGAIVVRQR
jgi:plastocyanin